MGCSQSIVDDTTVLDAVRLRFPRVDVQDVAAFVRYALAKEQQRHHLPGLVRREELLKILSLVLQENATPEARAFLEVAGGLNVFAGGLIDLYCDCARNGKNNSRAV